MALTDRQAQVLAFVGQSLGARGFPPTQAEIADHFGWSSPNAALQHLQALRRKGAITMARGTARGIQIVPGLADAFGPARGMEARSDETPQAAQPEGRQPGPQDAPKPNVGTEGRATAKG